MATTKVEISKSTIVFTVFFLMGLWFLYQIRNILVMLLISFILMSAILPVINLAKKVKIPTTVTVIVIYLILLMSMAGIIASIVPVVMEQLTSLVNQFPTIIATLDSEYNFTLDSGLLTGYISDASSNILKIATGAFSNTINIFAIFFMTYYLIIERENMHKYFTRLLGRSEIEHRVERLIRTIEKKIGHWVNGQIILMFIIGLATYIGLALLSVPYALPLALIAGLLEIIPNIGPTIAAIPAVIVGLTVSPVTALGTVVLAIIIQQLENNLIVPQVIRQTVGIKPLITITVLFIGLATAGVVGAILAIPIYIIIETILEEKNSLQKGV